jgi:hypothetical protein
MPFVEGREDLVPWSQSYVGFPDEWDSVHNKYFFIYGQLCVGARNKCGVERFQRCF